MVEKIVINPIGGLANRMRCIASGLTLAKSLNISSEIIWPVDNDLYASFEDLFQPNAIPTSIRNISSITDICFFDSPRKKNLYLSNIFHSLIPAYKNTYTHRISDSNLFLQPTYNESTLIDIARSLNGKLLIRSGVEYFPYSDVFYRTIFMPQIDITKAAMQIKQRFIDPTYGIHIRRTDNKESISKSPVSLFISQIKSILSQSPGAKFYIASDDQDVKLQLYNTFPNNTILNNTRVTRQTKQGMKDALMELILLSSTKRIFGSYYSSYSEAAAKLGDTHLTVLTDKL